MHGSCVIVVLSICAMRGVGSLLWYSGSGEVRWWLYHELRQDQGQSLLLIHCRWISGRDKRGGDKRAGIACGMRNENYVKTIIHHSLSQ